MAKQLTPQEKKIKDLRSTGLSLREIAEKLKISRSQVEDALVAEGELISSPKIDTSEKKATVKKVAKTKGK